MKQCTRCKEYKDETEFYKSNQTKDGLGCYCKKCFYNYTRKYQIKTNNKHVKIWQKKNKKKLSEYHTKWLKNNRKKWNEYQREHHHKNYVPTTPIIIKCDVCSKEVSTVRYHQKYCKECKEKIKRRKRDIKRRKLKWKILYSNPFDETILVVYHHINTTYVVPLPADIHRCYGGYHTRDDNEDLDYIIEQIYPSFDLIKNSLRKS